MKTWSQEDISEAFSRIREFGLRFMLHGHDDTMNSHINRLRRKIEVDLGSSPYMVTARGVGYRFAEQERLTV